MSDDAQRPTASGFPTSNTNFGFGETSQTTNPNPNASFWSVDYYQQYFDVDSDQVGKRLVSAVFPRGNFLEQVGNNLELYGPFWISTTVIFALFVASSISESVASYLAGAPFEYDFRLLSFAMTTSYVYAFVVPVIVWAACRWFGASAHLLELVEIYGYSMTIWIPVSVCFNWKAANGVVFGDCTGGVVQVGARDYCCEHLRLLFDSQRHVNHITGRQQGGHDICFGVCTCVSRCVGLIAQVLLFCV